MTVSITSDLLAPRIDDRLAGFLDDWRPPVSDPDVAATYQLLVDFILGGGKRVRPQLCYSGWRGGGGEDRGENISCAPPPELCRPGLLTQDRIIDGTELRPRPA